MGYMTSSVQFGFIVGTLCFAFFAISDRFSPRIVYFICSLLGACSNVLIYLAAEGMASLLTFRFITGFFLAGIYPVGMKISSGWYQKGLGKALGFLVGAVVVGTAFPHLLKGADQALPWEKVILSISALALVGGLLMLKFVPDGPYLFKGTTFNSKALIVVFQSKAVRSAAFGYFGHMWELYTVWAFLPMILLTFISKNPGTGLNIPLWTFSIIAIGGLGCAVGGMVSKRVGSARVAFVQLAGSGICCLISPLLFYLPIEWFLGILLLWGISVAGDSPQFSTLVAQTAPQDLVGSALTIVNCIGFSITIISIQLANYLYSQINPTYLFLFLTIGPLFGLISLWPLLKTGR